jgi:hypothetical protein
MEVYLPWNNDPTKHICLRRRGFKSSLAHHWSEFFLEIRHQFHTSILLSNWILTNQQTSIWNLGSYAYFEYTSCYFKVVTLFMRNLFRVGLPYLLLIRRVGIIFLFVHWKQLMRFVVILIYFMIVWILLGRHCWDPFITWSTRTIITFPQFLVLYTVCILYISMCVQRRITL